MMECPGRLNSAASCASAIAMPTAFPVPCPSGPVVASTPGVTPCSECPGVRLPHCRNCLMSSSVRRSEEHTSELQSRLHLVCRLLLEKKKKHTKTHKHYQAMDCISTMRLTLSAMSTAH